VVLVEPWDTISTTTVLKDSASIAAGLTGSASGSTVMPGFWVANGDVAPITWPSGSNSGSTVYVVPKNNGTPTSGSGWMLLEPYPAQQYYIKQLVNADYIVASPYNPITNTTSAITLPIAKSARLRLATTIMSESIDGAPITYSALSNPDNNRQASDGTNIEWQVVFPRFSTGSVVKPFDYAVVSAYVPTSGTGVVSASKPVYLEECLPHRVWARRYTQT